MTLKIPRRLDSPNTWNGRHWREKHRISQAWEQEIAYGGAADLAATRVNPRIPSRRVVTVQRQVPTRRNFIKDDDNLMAATKPLVDALKRQRLIYDDSRYWLALHMPTQAVSSDGKDYTIVTIEPIT